MTDGADDRPYEAEGTSGNFKDISRVINLKITETSLSGEILVIATLADDTEHFLLMKDEMAYKLAGIVEERVILRQNRKQKGVTN